MARGTQHVTRTTDILKAEGFTYGIVERRIPKCAAFPFGKTSDYLGLIDVIAIKGAETRGVQICGEDFACHERKMLGTLREHESEYEGNARRRSNAVAWLSAPHRTLHLIGWRKVVVRNKDGSKAKVKRWTPRVKIFTLEDYRGL